MARSQEKVASAIDRKRARFRGAKLGQLLDKIAISQLPAGSFPGGFWTTAPGARGIVHDGASSETFT
jgi:hypothetical protein